MDNKNSQPLLSTLPEPSSILNTLTFTTNNEVGTIIFPIFQIRKYAQRGWVTCLASHSEKVIKLQF